MALTTAPTAKLLCAEILRTKINIRADLKNSLLLVFVTTGVKKCVNNVSPGDAHTDIVREWYDGADRDGELGVRTCKLVFFVNISNYQSNYNKREEV